MNKSRRVAVVGSGISGALAAWLLRDRVDVRLYESDSRFGGHTHTVRVEEHGRSVEIDTGFMVFNRPNYPILVGLFDALGIQTYPTDMSFSASIDGGRFEYSGSSLATLFAQRRNLLSAGYLGMLADILRFNRAARRSVGAGAAQAGTLGEFLDEHRLGVRFREHYLYPMAAAIWSCPPRRIAEFPASSFLRFFANHGLISVNDRPQWETVRGGASVYMRRLVADLGVRAECGRAVTAVERTGEGVAIRFADGRRDDVDDVILACHSDQALAMLTAPTPSERQVLQSIAYQPNRVLLHTDAALMPRRRRVWSSWNYLARSAGSGDRAVSVTYWMNSLQDLATGRDYFVSLNPLVEPRADAVVAEFSYAHPVFDAAALAAQARLPQIQGRDRVWFAGAWTGYGFHEDGARSAVEVALALGADRDWADGVDRSRRLVADRQPVRDAA